MRKFLPAEKTVLEVLAYAAVFGDSVPRTQLIRFQRGTSFSESQLDAAVQSLQKNDYILSLPKDSSSQVVAQKWRSVARAIFFLQRFPWIESIWVTGGLAIGNIREEDDVDLMIITRPNSLWLTRAVVSLQDLFFQRIRRRGDHDHTLQDKWCCNLWLESSAVELQQDQRSLYSAREIIQAVPVFQRGAGTAEKFLEQNSWVRALLPQGFVAALARAQQLDSFPKSKSPSFAWLNMLFFRLQTWRMQRYRQHEIVEPQRAFFHPGERAKEVQQKYEKILEAIFS